MTLNEGDMFMTGCPAGMGFAGAGDKLEGKLWVGENVLESIEMELKLE